MRTPLERPLIRATTRALAVAATILAMPFIIAFFLATKGARL